MNKDISFNTQAKRREEWNAEIGGGFCNCPKCGARVEIKNTTERVIREYSLCRNRI